MQRPPYQGFPNQGGPMGPGGFPGQVPPNQQGFGLGRPFPPGQYGPPGAHPGMPPQNGQQQQGCFMPAATIRKISNTTPPNFNSSFQ